MSADSLRILGDKLSKPVALLVYNDFMAVVKLNMLINGILNLVLCGTPDLTNSSSFRKSQPSEVEDVFWDAFRRSLILVK